MTLWTIPPMKFRQTRGLPWSKQMRRLLAALVPAWLLFASSLAHAQGQGQGQAMMVRISEIAVHAQHLDAYKAILKEEAEASIRLEPGVIAIFPMTRRDSDTEFRILEMYADRQAYEAHLKTPHFLKYKSTTLHMVKSLKLVDMQAIDAQTMGKMFRKMQDR